MVKPLQKIIICFLTLIFIMSNSTNAQSLTKLAIVEDDIVLVDVLLNNQLIVESIEAYESSGKLLLSIEPIFDGLKIKYQILDGKIIIWNNDSTNEHTFILSEDPSTSSKNSKWGTDGYGIYLSQDVLSNLFLAQYSYIKNRLVFDIRTEYKKEIFPLQKISEQNKLRNLNQIYKTQADVDTEETVITLPDQYRLFTVPHGRVNIGTSYNSKSQHSLDTSLQLTSDLLYHSADLTLTDTNDSDFNARLTLSRYKTQPNELILGLFDDYRLGDITSYSNNLTTTSNSGLGAIFNRNPANYRNSNQAVTIQETAPPGWEAELFLNGVFINSKTVPNNGLLTFDNVSVYYGSNLFQIKLFGPYGEEEFINKRYNLKQNPLTKDVMAYSIYALDNNHRLINDKNNENYGVTNFGATFDYGISDNWQLGLSLASLENDRQTYGMRNAFSFPGFLLENDISFDQDGNYAQQTNLLGTIIGDDSYSLKFESANNFESDRIFSSNAKYEKYSASYYKPFDKLQMNFSTSFQTFDNGTNNFEFANRLSTNIYGINFSNTLRYVETKLNDNNTNNLLDNYNNILGNLTASGIFLKNFRVSANVDYDPRNEDDFFLPSSSFSIQTKFSDPFEGKHYITARYRPLTDEYTSAWRLEHRVAWQNQNFQMNLSTYYDENDDWSLQLGIRFFLGYDYRNNKFLFDNRIPSSSATLDIHTYLDRQINGIPDVLDYNLSGVEFLGQKEWSNFTSGKEGRTILPGVYAGAPIQFSAKWQQGSRTINNDYVVFTHPGAYINVNMPFVLSNDIYGFIMRQQLDREIAQNKTKINLINENGIVERSIESDRDGYYEFNGLMPGKYQVVIEPEYLKDKSYTGKVTGYYISLAGSGGYIELPALKIRRKDNFDDLDDESTIVYNIDQNNVEPMVWDDNINIRQNYFTLPASNTIEAKHSLSDIESAGNTVNQLPKKEIEKTTESEIIPWDNNKKVKALNNFSNLAFNENSIPTVNINNSEAILISDNNQAIKHKSIPQSLIQGKNDSQQNFTIQLGSYNNLEEANRLKSTIENSYIQEYYNTNDQINYKIRLGSFINKASALDFAEKNLNNQQDYFVVPQTIIDIQEKSENTVKTPLSWVIQFFANKTQISSSDLNKYKKIGKLFSARKVDPKNITKKLYVLISKNFDNKAAAMRALDDSNISGWVTQRNEYTDVQPLM